MNDSSPLPAKLSVAALIGDALGLIRAHHDHLLWIAFLPALISLAGDLAFRVTQDPIIALVGTIASFVAHGSFAIGWLDYALRGTLPAGLVPAWDRRVLRYLLWLLALMTGGIYGAYAVGTVLGANLLVLGIAALGMSMLILRFTLVFPAIAAGKMGYTPLQSWRDLKTHFWPYCIAIIALQIPFAVALGILLVLSQESAIGDQFALTLSLVGVMIEYLSSAAILAVMASAFRSIVRSSGTR